MAAQMLFFAVAFLLQSNNLDITPEAETGTAP
jgi:hypothetical protein